MQDKYTKKQDNAKQFKFLFYPIIGFHTHLGKFPLFAPFPLPREIPKKIPPGWKILFPSYLNPLSATFC